MKELIQSIFGEYVPITYTSTETVYNSDGTVLSETVTEYIANGSSGVDWQYVLGVVAFLLVLYCILRIIGGVISRV